MYSPVKAALAEHSGKKVGRLNKTNCMIDITMKIFCSNQSHCNQLGIRRIMVNRFFMTNFYHDIINKDVNCNKFFYHILQVIWFGDLNLEGFLIIPNLYMLDYQYINNIYQHILLIYNILTIFTSNYNLQLK